MRAFRGSDRVIDSVILVERFWESRPERVKAPYMKGEQTWRDPEYHETRGTLWERKGPREGSEREPETLCLQAVEDP